MRVTDELNLKKVREKKERKRKRTKTAVPVSWAKSIEKWGNVKRVGPTLMKTADKGCVTRLQCDERDIQKGHSPSGWHGGGRNTEGQVLVRNFGGQKREKACVHDLGLRHMGKLRGAGVWGSSLKREKKRKRCPPLKKLIGLRNKGRVSA